MNDETIDEAIEDAEADASTEAETPTDDGDAPVPGAVKASRKRAAKAPKAGDAPTAPVEAKAPEVGDKVYLDGDESVEWTLGKVHSANLVLLTRETSPGHYLGEHVSPSRINPAS